MKKTNQTGGTKGKNTRKLSVCEESMREEERGGNWHTGDHDVSFRIWQGQSKLLVRKTVPKTRRELLSGTNQTKIVVREERWKEGEKSLPLLIPLARRKPQTAHPR